PRSPLSQPFLDQHFGNQALEPHNEAAVVDIHTHPRTPTTDLTILPVETGFFWKWISPLMVVQKNALCDSLTGLFCKRDATGGCGGLYERVARHDEAIANCHRLHLRDDYVGRCHIQC